MLVYMYIARSIIIEVRAAYARTVAGGASVLPGNVGDPTKRNSGKRKEGGRKKGGNNQIKQDQSGQSESHLNFHSPCFIPPFSFFEIHPRGVQWKQGVVVHIRL